MPNNESTEVLVLLITAMQTKWFFYHAYCDGTPSFYWFKGRPTCKENNILVSK